jgi:hypothetical protein
LHPFAFAAGVAGFGFVEVALPYRFEGGTPPAAHLLAGGVAVLLGADLEQEQVAGDRVGADAAAVAEGAPGAVLERVERLHRLAGLDDLGVVEVDEDAA